MRKYLLPIVAVAGIVSATSAFAVTASGTFVVSVNITKACSVSATAVNFGSLSTILGTESANSTVSVICNVGTPYNLSFVSADNTAITAAGNLANGANTIPVNYAFASAAAASGTGNGGTAATNTIAVTLPTATPYPTVGLYTQTRTVYVNY